MRPSSSVTTIPNSSGFSTDLSPIVTAAPRSLWNSTRRVRSKSQRASPEMTRNVSSSLSGARAAAAEGVAGDDEEPLVELARRGAGGAGRARGRFLDGVLDVHALALAVSEVAP